MGKPVEIIYVPLHRLKSQKMSGKFYLSLWLFVFSFVVCAAVETRGNAVFWQEGGEPEASGLQEVVEEVSAKVPYFFFSHDYVLPLSSAAGTVCEVPGVKCMEVWSHIVRGFFDPESAEDSARGQAFSFIPPPAADKDYYVFALRRIVV